MTKMASMPSGGGGPGIFISHQRISQRVVPREAIGMEDSIAPRGVFVRVFLRKHK